MRQHRGMLGSAGFVVIMTGITLSALLISPRKVTNSRAYAQSGSAAPHCVHVGGSLITNLGAIDQTTTMGPATGDLRESAGGTLLAPPSVSPQAVIQLRVLHHWVTESGDEILFPPTGIAETATPAGGGVFGATPEPLHLAAGTGKFNGASGTLNAFGAIHLTFDGAGQTTGDKRCSGTPGKYASRRPTISDTGHHEASTACAVLCCVFSL